MDVTLSSLQQEVREALEGGRAGYLQIAFPIAPVALRSWLRQQDRRIPRFYWSDHEGTLEVAALGVADRLMQSSLDLPALMAQLTQRLAQLPPSAFYYGGVQFPSQRQAMWPAFGAAHFILPRMELRREGTQYTMYYHLVLPRDRERRPELLTTLEGLLDVPAPSGRDALPEVLCRRDFPDRSGWKRMMERALGAFARGAMEKVVLARQVTFMFATPPDEMLLLERLVPETPHCYHFLFAPAQGEAFLGASPERLYLRTGRRLETEAIAGTRPRGRTPEEDQRLARALLESEKDRREHMLVVESIQRELLPRAVSLERDAEIQLLQLTRKQHLLTRFHVLLQDPVHEADLLRALYPTPAVGGTPRAEALTWIAREEPFDRGWYTGLLGRVGRRETEWMVGIRCGRVHGRTLDLFSGAGIVQGSTAENEWQEIEHKISDFLEILVL